MEEQDEGKTGGEDYESKYDAAPDPTTPSRETKQQEEKESGHDGDNDNNEDYGTIPMEATSFGFSRVVNPPGSYGGKTMSLEHAESPHSRVSKRYDAITDGAEKLENDQTFLRTLFLNYFEMIVLTIIFLFFFLNINRTYINTLSMKLSFFFFLLKTGAQAIAKNRAFIVRIEALHERIGRWEIRVHTETEERETEDASIRVTLATKLINLEERFVKKLEIEEKKIELEEVPAVHAR